MYSGDILNDIFKSAFSLKSFGVGTLSTLLIGMQKGIFSSEVGLGTGAIASVTADTDSPAKNGLVQIFEIHFENIIIATITAFVVCMFNYQNLIIADPNGIEISAKKVREAFIKGDIEKLRMLVPESTIEVLRERYYVEDKSIKRKVLK